MRIIVCIKQVPDTNEVKIDQKTGTLIREGVPSIMNPDDRNALEEALSLKDEFEAEVVVLSMGPPQAKDVILEAFSMGADCGYLISDRKFGGSDTWATATIISAAIEKIGNYDLIFCGRQAIDGDTAQVGPEIAEFLGIPQVTYAKEVSISDGGLKISRFSEYGDFIYTAKYPLMITAIKELNKPRYPTIKGILESFNEEKENEIVLLTAEDLDVDESQIGLKGSPTNVYRSFVPVKDNTSEIIEGDTTKEKTDTLIRRLAKVNLV